MDIQEIPVELGSASGDRVLFATLIAGLESVAADEVLEEIHEASVLAAARGRLFFHVPGPADEALDLLTVENIFFFVDQFCGVPLDRSGLSMIEKRLRQIDLGAALAEHHRLHGVPTRASFRITAHRSGNHDYNSVEVAAAAGAGVVQSYGWDVDLEGYDYDIRLYVTGESVLVGLRLSPEALHQRTRVEHAAASLNPTVAHAICRISEPRAGETVVDPMCGAGTILIERSRLGAPGLLLGGEIAEEPLHSAQVNLREAAVSAPLVRWDARRLPLREGAVDCVICNLPWGRRIGSHRANRHLYPGFLRELARILRPCGRAVLLTQEKRLLTGLASRSPRLHIVNRMPLSLSGMHPSIYVLERTCGPR